MFLYFDGVSISSIYIQSGNAVFALNKKSCLGAKNTQWLYSIIIFWGIQEEMPCGFFGASQDADKSSLYL